MRLLTIIFWAVVLLIITLQILPACTQQPDNYHVENVKDNRRFNPVVDKLAMVENTVAEIEFAPAGSRLAGVSGDAIVFFGESGNGARLSWHDAEDGQQVVAMDCPAGVPTLIPVRDEVLINSYDLLTLYGREGLRWEFSHLTESAFVAAHDKAEQLVFVNAGLIEGAIFDEQDQLAPSRNLDKVSTDGEYAYTLNANGSFYVVSLETGLLVAANGLNTHGVDGHLGAYDVGDIACDRKFIYLSSPYMYREIVQLHRAQGQPTRGATNFRENRIRCRYHKSSAPVLLDQGTVLSAEDNRIRCYNKLGYLLWELMQLDGSFFRMVDLRHVSKTAANTAANEQQVFVLHHSLENSMNDDDGEVIMLTELAIDGATLGTTVLGGYPDFDGHRGSDYDDSKQSFCGITVGEDNLLVLLDTELLIGNPGKGFHRIPLPLNSIRDYYLSDKVLYISGEDQAGKVVTLKVFSEDIN